jgi:hypothetical protein
MNYSKQLISGIAMAFVPFLVSARTTIGVVVDSITREPIECAGVKALDADNNFVSGTVTNEQGIFKFDEIQAAKYSASLVGYNDKIVDVSNFNDTIFLSQNTILKEIEVKGLAKPLEFHNGIIDFNPSFVANATSAADLVRQSPGIIEIDKNLSMPGKDGFAIYINGRRQKGDIKEIMLMLKSYPADNVERIEIMRNPSAKYAAGGNEGVINIVLKKKNNDFLGGNAALGYQQNNTNSEDIEAGLIYKRNKLTTSLNAAGNLEKSKFVESNNTAIEDYTRNQVANYDNKNSDFVVRAEAIYDFSKKWSADVIASYLCGNELIKTHTVNKSWRENLQNPFEIVSSANKRRNKSKTYFASASTDGDISKKIHMTISTDLYRRIQPTTRNIFDINENVETMYQHDDLRSTNVSPKANVSIACDSTLNFNFGLEPTFTTTNSNIIGAFRIQSLKDEFKYTENIIAGFAEVKKQFSEKFALEGSLRWEYTWIKAHNNMLNTIHKDYYNSVIPSLSIDYTPNENNSLSLSFYSNVNRPTLTSVNPAKIYYDDYNYRKGNTNLEPSRHYYTGITYSRGSFMISPYLEWLKNGIEIVSQLDENNSIASEYANVSDEFRTGIYAYYGWNKLSWLRVAASAFTTYEELNSKDLRTFGFSRDFFYSIMPNCQIFLDKKQRFILAFYAYFRGKTKSVNAQSKEQWSLTSTFTWAINNNWNLSLIGDNLLASHARGYQVVGDTRMFFNNKFNYTAVKLTISYTWGINMKDSYNSTLNNMNRRTVVQ